jgi:hypothetical protein
MFGSFLPPSKDLILNQGGLAASAFSLTQNHRLSQSLLPLETHSKMPTDLGSYPGAPLWGGVETQKIVINLAL